MIIEYINKIFGRKEKHKIEIGQIYEHTNSIVGWVIKVINIKKQFLNDDIIYIKYISSGPPYYMIHNHRLYSRDDSIPVEKQRFLKFYIFSQKLTDEYIIKSIIE